MNDVEIPDEIPGNFLEEHFQEGLQNRKIKDELYIAKGKRKEQMRAEVEKVIRFIKESIFVKIHSLIDVA